MIAAACRVPLLRSYHRNELSGIYVQMMAFKVQLHPSCLQTVVAPPWAEPASRHSWHRSSGSWEGLQSPQGALPVTPGLALQCLLRGKDQHLDCSALSDPGRLAEA